MEHRWNDLSRATGSTRQGQDFLIHHSTGCLGPLRPRAHIPVAQGTPHLGLAASTAPWDRDVWGLTHLKATLLCWGHSVPGRIPALPCHQCRELGQLWDSGMEDNHP